MSDKELKINFIKDYLVHTTGLAIGILATLLGGILVGESLQIARELDYCKAMPSEVSNWLCAIDLYLSAAKQYGDSNPSLWIEPVVTALGIGMSGYTTTKMFKTAYSYFQGKNGE